MLDFILSRRSIRKYQDKPIPEEMLQRILHAAAEAPSAGNQQPWHFIVLKDRKVLDAVPSVHPHSKMILKAPCAIVVCGDPTLEKHAGYWVQDCSAATENILLAAHSLGLGAVWLGVYPRQDRVDGLRALLKIPEHVIPLAIVPMGYPAEQKPPGNRFNQERVHLNHW